MAQFLTTIEGESAVSEAVKLLDDRIGALAGLTQLRKRLSPERARAVWSAALLRKRAIEKIGSDAEVLLFDQDGYEMSSGWATAAYHADLLFRSGAQRVLDLCSGVGLDTIALARRGLYVMAYELDEGRALLLRENIRRLGFTAQVTIHLGDVTRMNLEGADAAFFDPARRSDSRKWSGSSESTSPPLSFIESIRSAGISRIAAKLSPAVDRKVSSDFEGSLEFLSVKGECREALLLLGELANGAYPSAVLLPQNDRFFGSGESTVSNESGGFLWEPDAAVIRAGLTGTLAKSLGGWLRDPAVDYFFTHQAGASPFAVCYRVLREFPYSRRALQEALTGSGKVVMKQRAFPQSIDEVASKLKLSGASTATVVLTKLSGDSTAFIVERLSSENIWRQ